MVVVALEQLGALPRLQNKLAQNYAMRLKRITGDEFERGALEASKHTTGLEAKQEWLQTKKQYCTLLAYFESQLSMAKNHADLKQVKSKVRNFVVKHMLQQSGIVTAIFHPLIQVAYNLIALEDAIGQNHISTKAISSALAYSADVLKSKAFYVRPSYSKVSASSEFSFESLEHKKPEYTSLWFVIERMYARRDYFISTMKQNEEQLKRNLIVDIFQEVVNLFKEDVNAITSNLQLYKHIGDKQTLNFILDEIHEFATLLLLTTGVSDLITLHLVTGSHSVRVVLEKLFNFKSMDFKQGDDNGPNSDFACQVDMIQQLLDAVLIGYIYAQLPYVDRLGLHDKCKQDVSQLGNSTLNWPAVQKLVISDEHADEHHVKFLYTCKTLAKRQHPEMYICAAKLRCESRRQ